MNKMKVLLGRRDSLLNQYISKIQLTQTIF